RSCGVLPPSRARDRRLRLSEILEEPLLPLQPAFPGARPEGEPGQGEPPKGALLPEPVRVEPLLPGIPALRRVVREIPLLLRRQAAEIVFRNELGVLLLEFLERIRAVGARLLPRTVRRRLAHRELDLAVGVGLEGDAPAEIPVGRPSAGARRPFPGRPSALLFELAEQPLGPEGPLRILVLGRSAKRRNRRGSHLAKLGLRTFARRVLVGTQVPDEIADLLFVRA